MKYAIKFIQTDCHECTRVFENQIPKENMRREKTRSSVVLFEYVVYNVIILLELIVRARIRHILTTYMMQKLTDVHMNYLQRAGFRSKRNSTESRPCGTLLHCPGYSTAPDKRQGASWLSCVARAAGWTRQYGIREHSSRAYSRLSVPSEAVCVAADSFLHTVNAAIRSTSLLSIDQLTLGRE